MKQIEIDDIDFIVEEIILRIIDDDSLDFSNNMQYDESDKYVTYISLEETMSFYGVNINNVKEIIKEINNELGIHLLDISYDNLSISQLIEICKEQYGIKRTNI